MSYGDVTAAVVLNARAEEEDFSWNVASRTELHGSSDGSWRPAAAAGHAYYSLTVCLPL